MKSEHNVKAIRQRLWLSIVVMGMLLSGCSHLEPENVKPWQRGNLAKADMQLDATPLHTLMDEHIYFSREAMTGGKGLGGGGCGCN